MRNPYITLLVTMICIGLPLYSHAQTSTFEQKYVQAKANAAGGAGARYDQQLGTAMQSLPGLVSAMHDCAMKNPGQPSLHGYFEFTSATHYRVVLEPKGTLAGCITGVLENRTVPAPPRAPYLDPFELNLTQ